MYIAFTSISLFIYLFLNHFFTWPHKSGGGRGGANYMLLIQFFVSKFKTKTFAAQKRGGGGGRH